MQSGCGSFYAVMEGRGAYNKHAKLPANGVALALALHKKAGKTPICSYVQTMLLAKHC